MDIPNLSQELPVSKPAYSFSLPVLIFILLFSLAAGFWMFRFFPRTTTNTASSNPLTKNEAPLSTDKIENSEDLKVGQLYGNTGKTFNDSASGTLKAGSINGEGTHILERPGGDTQRVSLTSSSVDLDLFVGKKVEVRGETNSSKKTGWLIDVGSIKILE